MDGKHILIVGSGSVGKRHARNLAALGCRISGMDPRADRREEMASEVKLVAAFASEQEAYAAAKYDGVVIASPPHVHVRQTVQALEAGCPVLLEKPVCPDLKGARALQEAAKRTKAPLLMGYTWRWWPPLADVRRLLDEKAVGAIHHVQFHMSAHLADWHPWERYQDFFMAQREQGGGALLDESHWIDLMLWLFGMPKEVSGKIDKISTLEITSDDNVDLLFTYEDGPRVTMHLDLYGRPHEKFIRFVGADGTIFWSADPNQLSVGRTAAAEWDKTAYRCERNDMFVAVAKEFLAAIDGAPVKTCNLDDGVNVLRVIEAARAASSENRAAAIGD
ncbi:MAG: Gfo/Idh/MocA family oxidoreductase [Pseudorhodoplanes sp.]|nr:Gfo/Idh/MocA family oxidoreductase [Pseudorhodoplanes sp.]